MLQLFLLRVNLIFDKNFRSPVILFFSCHNNSVFFFVLKLLMKYWYGGGDYNHMYGHVVCRDGGG